MAVRRGQEGDVLRQPATPLDQIQERIIGGVDDVLRGAGNELDA